MFSTLEIVLSLAQHEGFCPAGELFDRDHPIQRHLESALLVNVVCKILELKIGTGMQVFVAFERYFGPRECMEEGKRSFECADIDEFKEDIAVEESLPTSKPQGP